MCRRLALSRQSRGLCRSLGLCPLGFALLSGPALRLGPGGGLSRGLALLRLLPQSRLAFGLGLLTGGLLPFGFLAGGLLLGRLALGFDSGRVALLGFALGQGLAGGLLLGRLALGLLAGRFRALGLRALGLRALGRLPQSVLALDFKALGLGPLGLGPRGIEWFGRRAGRGLLSRFALGRGQALGLLALQLQARHVGADRRLPLGFLAQRLLARRCLAGGLLSLGLAARGRRLPFGQPALRLCPGLGLARRLRLAQGLLLLGLSLARFQCRVVDHGQRRGVGAAGGGRRCRCRCIGGGCGRGRGNGPGLGLRRGRADLGAGGRRRRCAGHGRVGGGLGRCVGRRCRRGRGHQAHPQRRHLGSPLLPGQLQARQPEAVAERQAQQQRVHQQGDRPGEGLAPAFVHQPAGPPPAVAQHRRQRGQPALGGRRARGG
ncbi:MAG: hypothetical protein GXD23_14480 [Comamonadaceae bacterium]|nr:hypothetical protein [Comamonadaceae bacterium]